MNPFAAQQIGISLRPVRVEGRYVYEGWFHCWAKMPVNCDDGGTYALVEGENGGINLVEPYLIKFLDR